uniref:Uncharacterized protein n=1 Tax=Arundo donax TaxID=35708 RepID=A0A0A9B1V2_ARUDO
MLTASIHSFSCPCPCPWGLLQLKRKNQLVHACCESVPMTCTPTATTMLLLCPSVHIKAGS